MNLLPTVLAYLGPETMLPMTSIVAGVVGVLMMFGRNAWLWVSGTARKMASRGSVGSNAVPHRRIGSAETSRETAGR